MDEIIDLIENNWKSKVLIPKAKLCEVLGMTI